ncbi:GNAT family N-acetyltransferase [Oceanobacillus halotolerans]|uniref:GNAT family N-acetyltransferase n=1 Tax=Oceanobacillus halotolerans TaxID=2663380 RepID=UPI0013DAC2DA|nr:GNAT family N-acetyltransferase [Oceanobacillus halotolerans]
MNWYRKSFQELTNKELYQLMKARVDVFVVEQECPYPELDNYDQEALHFFAKMDDEIVAIVRLLPADLKFKEASIGRVMVVEKYRGNGYATQIMEKAIKFITEEWEETAIKIQAQEYLKNFYGSLGFEQISESYLEDDIPHIDMIWERK